MLHACRAACMLAVITLAPGCAPHRPAARGSSEAGTTSPSDILTNQELARLVRQGSLMDALQQLRPFWLGTRGTPPLVSLDGSTPTELSYLRQIPVSTVHEVRLQRASSSVGRAVIRPDGDVAAVDVIVVSTRRGDRGGHDAGRGSRFEARP
jgi:hypothetical protein